MAAAVHGYGPGADITRANTARIVWQALDWGGLFNDEVREHWNRGELHPTIDQVYGQLVRMTHQLNRIGPGRRPERPGEALFEGGGNWGVPGDPERPPNDPWYNSSRLTPMGEQVARALLEEFPEYRKAGQSAAPNRGNAT